jgi:4-hydroxybenzoate polyprenyltransferase/phosphoserine phosphatase
MNGNRIEWRDPLNPTITEPEISEKGVGIRSAESGLAFCVDLDGTLVRTDTLMELLLSVLRAAPWRVVFIPFWILRGKAFLKRRVSLLGSLRVESLPYRQDLLELIRSELRDGRRLVLASGADHTIATRIANHLNLFDDVLASDGNKNLVGAAKANAIQSLLGSQRFVYAGNSRHDLDVWMRSEGAILVNAPSSYRSRLERRGKNVLRVLPAKGSSWRSYLSAIRLHHWVKNVLIFVPLLLSHKIINITIDLKGLLGFAAFSLAASSLYIVNDLLDIEADRKHPRKRNRTFASGELSIPSGFALILLLASASILLSYWLPWQARYLLAGYAVASLVYSLHLKRYLFVDVVLLASFFTLRVIVGGAATGIEISIWTLAFSMFLFLSLALLKRLMELRMSLAADSSSLARRGYLAEDVPLIASLSSSSGLLAVLVLALYLQSTEVHALYSHAPVLWLVCPLLLYWLGRLAILANRGTLHDDPLVFVITDRASWIVGFLTLGVLAFAV